MTVYEGVVVWSFAGNEFNTVLHYDDNGMGPPNFQGLTNDFWDVFNAHGMPYIASEVAFEAMRWREDTPGGVGVELVPSAGRLVGSDTTSNPVGQAALIIRKLGSGLVRPTKGRIYQPGIGLAGITADGLWPGVVSNALESMWEDLLTPDDHSGVTMQMVIKASNPSAPNTQAYTPVAALQAIGNPGTQRRRRLGSGV